MFFSPKTKTGLEFPIYKVSAFLQTNLDLVLEMFLNILKIFFQTTLYLVWKRALNKMKLQCSAS